MKNFLFLALIASCGGSGVDSGVKLINLTPSQEMDLCNYFQSNAPAKRTIDCGGGMTVTVGNSSQTVAQCVTTFDMSKSSHPSCTATVGDAENCFDAESTETDAWYCSQLTPNPLPPPAECVAVATAACQG